MASLILSTAGNALFGPIGGFIGALAGSAIDNAAITALTPARVQPSRLAGLKVQASQEGAAIPIVYGRFRIAGQIIWASKFNEINTKRTVGGKGGQRVIERSYTISFAIGLCEGPIDGIGRVWINGEQIDLATLAHRVYLGGETQMPDPLIEAVEGMNGAPAFRGLSYIVFEDFAVSAYGDRIPQFGFEVMASPASANLNPANLKALTSGVCLIPGAGEFAYSTTLLRKIRGPGDEIGENLHASAARSDFDISLDNLKRDFPAVSNVSLVVAWFGTDLRAGQCQIVPKVESATKQTTPRAWSVAGLTRANAQVVSQSGGKPAYGGSPDDQSVIEGIIALKARGHRVTHNPFVMMDIASGNTLANPLGGTSQAPYPWRGRITCFPGIGQANSVDATAAAATQIASFFGTARAVDFTVSGARVTYSGPSEWSYRRFILHQAALTKAAGGVDAFLIGSEFIGLTRVRASTNSFPAVTGFVALAQEVRALLGPGVKISYGADWTEYGGYQPPGTTDLRFPLDPLWADQNIDFIGLDWYAPLTDVRVGDPRAEIASLKAGIESGEGYDFYYADEAARIAKTRTLITDTTYQEAWVWRQKDVRGFWANAHYERNGGIRSTLPTPWLAKSKPLALMELGFPAVDKGANRPSVFPDPKSVEAGVPPFSNGSRDDAEQRLALEATLAYWRDDNAMSPVYAGPMMDTSRCHVWAWDARPYPYFPGLVDVWADGEYAMLGHWLAGRTGITNLAALVRDICVRGGLPEVQVEGISGSVDGFAIEAPTSARNLLENLFTVFGLEAVTKNEGLVISDASAPTAQMTLQSKDILVQDGGLSIVRANQLFGGPMSGRFSCYATEQDYLPATQTTPATGQSGTVNAIASSVVLGPAARLASANRLARTMASDGLSLSVSPALSARLEAGDRVGMSNGGVWRVDRSEGQWSQTLSASRAPDQVIAVPDFTLETVPKTANILSVPIFVVLDVTAPFTSPTTPAPLVGCAAAIWPGNIEIAAGGKVVGTLSKPMTIGQLQGEILAGPVARLFKRPLVVSIKFDAGLPMSGQAALLADGLVVDIISWRQATLVGQGLWQLSDWVRGLNGVSRGLALPAGTSFILLDDALVEMQITATFVGLAIDWQAQPSADIALTANQTARFSALALQPWPPCRLSAKRTVSGIEFSWTRRARGNGDGWSSPNAPLGAALERYSFQIVTQAGAIIRALSVTIPSFLYSTAQEITDFGTQQSQVSVVIAQIGDDDLQGRPLNAVLAV